MTNLRHDIARVTLLTVALGAFTACGGGSTPAPLPMYSIGGTASGLDAGQSVVLHDNGGDNQTISANGAFTFATKVTSGGAYDVTLSGAPTGKTCTVTGASGTASANVTSVAVACLSNPTYPIGGTVTGLASGQSLVLQDNGADDLTVSADGAFTFATRVSSGAAYAVTIRTQPQGKYCAVADGVGTVTISVTTVAVACAGPYRVGGTVSGLVGQGLELSLAPQLLGIGGNGHYMFPAAVAPRTFGRVIDIAQQPTAPAQHCVVTHPYFTMTPPNVSDISDANVVCGEFLYAANSGADTVSGFSIDATTGAISSVGPRTPAGRSPSAMAATIDKKYLYVGNDASHDITAFTVDAGSGALTTIPGSPFAAGTSPKAVSVYTASFATTRGNHHWYLSYLYVANAGSDNLSAYQIDQGTGVITPLSPASYTTGIGPSAMAVRPDGQFLYVANSGGSKDISGFLIDGFSGGLAPIAGSPFRAGGKVNSLAFGAGEKFLYAADASGGAAAIFGFAIRPYIDPTAQFPNPDFGALIPLAGFPRDLPSLNSIATDQTGTYLYATAATNVFGYGIDAQTGTLSPLPGFPVAVGNNADSMSIDPTNQFLYVSNAGAGTVTGFALNAATGALTRMPGSPFIVGTSADFIATF